VKKSTVGFGSINKRSDNRGFTPAEKLRREFPDQLKDIFKLHPLRSLADVDGFLTDFAQIVYTDRKLANDDIKQATMLAIQSADDVVDKIELLRKNCVAMDADLLTPIFRLMHRVHPQVAPVDLRDDAFFGMLDWVQAMLTMFSLATAVSTDVSGPRKSRGRPRSKYVRTAIRLIQLWEHFTAEKVGVLKSIPTPKKNQGIIDQPSTEFMRIALQIIDPKIKESEVFTAIKHALETQKEFYQKLPSNPDVAKTLGQFFAMNERATLV
jgi:hypothetical protein